MISMPRPSLGFQPSWLKSARGDVIAGLWRHFRAPPRATGLSAVRASLGLKNRPASGAGLISETGSCVPLVGGMDPRPAG
jgi:hypothetical protein